MHLPRLFAAGLCALVLCCCLIEGTGVKIKLPDQCKCWTLVDGTVGLGDCDSDGTDFLVPEEEGPIRPVESQSDQCLLRVQTRLQLGTCPRGGALWRLSENNQYYLQQDSRRLCMRLISQATRIVMFSCQTGRVLGPQWEMLDLPEGQSACESEGGGTGEETSSSPPPPPPAQSSPSQSSARSLDRSASGVISAIANAEATGSGTASASARVNTEPKPQEDGPKTVGLSGSGDDDEKVAAIAGGSVAGFVLLSSVVLIGLYIFLRKRNSPSGKYNKSLFPDSDLSSVVLDNFNASSPQGLPPKQGNRQALPSQILPMGRSAGQASSEYNVTQYERAEATATLLSSSHASTESDLRVIAAGGGEGSYGGLTLAMLNQFGSKKARRVAPHEFVRSEELEEERSAVSKLIEKLSGLKEGSEFADRYIIESERFSGSGGVVFLARGKFNKDRVAIKFFVDESGFDKEVEVHRKLSAQYIARLEDVVPTKASGMPNALVFQRGDYTLEEWARKSRPKQLLVKLALNQILEGLNDLHSHYIIHRDLKPSNIMWFSSDHSWKLTDLDNWAPAGALSPVAYTLMYAAPEAVAPDIHGKNEVALETSADMWSFGIIAYELATGMRFFGTDPRREEVLQRLLGFGQMPDLSAVKERQLRRLIANTLQRDPQARWTAVTALGNAYFRSADDTLQQQEKFDQVNQTLARIEQMVAIAADEIRSANLMVNIVLESAGHSDEAGLGEWERDFEIIPGNECPMMTDDGLPDHPIFMLNLEHSYKMRLTITHQHSLPLRVQSVDYIMVTPVDGPAVQLKTHIINSDVDNVQALAIWDPAAHGAPSLQHITPAGGPLDRRLVPTDVAVVFTLIGQGSPSVLRGKLFLRMHRPGTKFVARKAFSRAGKMWDEAPQWVKDAAKGAIFLFNVATTVAGA